MNVQLKIVRGAVNPSVLPGKDRVDSKWRLLQRLRCSSDFRSIGGAEEQTLWNDFVAITGSHPQKGDSTWYARLVLLFHAQDPLSGKWIQLAFVRYLVRDEDKATEEARFAKKDDEPLVTVLKYATQSAYQQSGVLVLRCHPSRVYCAQDTRCRGERVGISVPYVFPRGTEVETDRQKGKASS